MEGRKQEGEPRRTYSTLLDIPPESREAEGPEFRKRCISWLGEDMARGRVPEFLATYLYEIFRDSASKKTMDSLSGDHAGAIKQQIASCVKELSPDKTTAQKEIGHLLENYGRQLETIFGQGQTVPGVYLDQDECLDVIRQALYTEYANQHQEHLLEGIREEREVVRGYTRQRRGVKRLLAECSGLTENVFENGIPLPLPENLTVDDICAALAVYGIEKIYTLKERGAFQTIKSRNIKGASILANLRNVIEQRFEEIKSALVGDLEPFFSKTEAGQKREKQEAAGRIELNMAPLRELEEPLWHLPPEAGGPREKILFDAQGHPHSKMEEPDTCFQFIPDQKGAGGALLLGKRITDRLTRQVADVMSGAQRTQKRLVPDPATVIELINGLLEASKHTRIEPILEALERNVGETNKSIHPGAVINALLSKLEDSEGYSDRVALLTLQLIKNFSPDSTGEDSAYADKVSWRSRLQTIILQQPHPSLYTLDFLVKTGVASSAMIYTQTLDRRDLEALAEKLTEDVVVVNQIKKVSEEHAEHATALFYLLEAAKGEYHRWYRAIQRSVDTYERTLDSAHQSTLVSIWGKLLQWQVETKRLSQDMPVPPQVREKRGVNAESAVGGTQTQQADAKDFAATVESILRLEWVKANKNWVKEFTDLKKQETGRETSGTRNLGQLLSMFWKKN